MAGVSGGGLISAAAKACWSSTRPKVDNPQPPQSSCCAAALAAATTKSVSERPSITRPHASEQRVHIRRQAGFETGGGWLCCSYYSVRQIAGSVKRTAYASQWPRHAHCQAGARRSAEAVAADYPATTASITPPPPPPPPGPARLPRPQVGIHPAALQQRRVRALLDDPALVHDDQPVHGGHCGQPVGDGDLLLAGISLSSCSWIAPSTSESIALVASSSTRIGGSVSSTRAIAIRWRWPPESFTPRSPTCAS